MDILNMDRWAHSSKKKPKLNIMYVPLILCFVEEITLVFNKSREND